MRSRMNLHVGVLHYTPSCEPFPLLADPEHYEPNTLDMGADNAFPVDQYRRAPQQKSQRYQASRRDDKAMTRFTCVHDRPLVTSTGSKTIRSSNVICGSIYPKRGR